MALTCRRCILFLIGFWLLLTKNIQIEGWNHCLVCNCKIPGCCFFSQQFLKRVLCSGQQTICLLLWLADEFLLIAFKTRPVPQHKRHLGSPHWICYKFLFPIVSTSTTELAIFLKSMAKTETHFSFTQLLENVANGQYLLFCLLAMFVQQAYHR